MTPSECWEAAASHKHAMIILGPEGHRMVAWRDQEECESKEEAHTSIEAAMKEFTRQRNLGKVPFEMNQAGTEGKPMSQFNPEAERIMFVAAIQGG